MKIGSARIETRSSPRATASQKPTRREKWVQKIMEPVCRAPCLFEFAYTFNSCCLSQKKWIVFRPHPEKQQFRWWIVDATLPGILFRCRRMRNRFLFYGIWSFTWERAKKTTLSEFGWIFSLGNRAWNNFTVAFTVSWFTKICRWHFLSTTKKCNRDRGKKEAVGHRRVRSHEISHRRHICNHTEQNLLSGRVRTSRSDIFYRLVGCLPIFGRGGGQLGISFLYYAVIILRHSHSRHRQKRFISNVFPRRHFVTGGRPL